MCKVWVHEYFILIFVISELTSHLNIRPKYHYGSFALLTPTLVEVLNLNSVQVSDKCGCLSW